jgi:hypothetical protein
LAVINDVFSKGEISHGMSGGASWKPFHIDQVEYEEAIEELLTRPGHSIVLEPLLEACTTYEDFVRAILNRLRGKV